MKNFRTLGTFGPMSFVATSMKPPQQVTKYIIREKVMVCLQVWAMMNFVKFCCLLFIYALIWLHLAQTALLFGFVQVDHSLNSYLWISLIPWISSISIPNLPHLFSVGVRDHALSLHSVTNLKIGRFVYFWYYL